MDYFLAVFWGNNLINLARVRESILANPSTGSRVRIIAVGRQPLRMEVLKKGVNGRQF